MLNAYQAKTVTSYSLKLVSSSSKEEIKGINTIFNNAILQPRNTVLLGQVATKHSDISIIVY